MLARGELGSIPGGVVRGRAGRQRGTWGRALVAALSLLGLAVALGPGRAAVATTTASYQNPVDPLDAPDPMVVSSGGLYYAFTTAGALGRIQEFTSPDLVHWSEHAPALTDDPSWAEPGYEWAPSVMEVQGTWLLYYTTFDIATETHCISVATAAQVAGPYVDDSAGPLECQVGFGGDLDPDVFSAGGTLYMAWKSNPGLYSDVSTLWDQPLAPDGRAFAAGSSPTLLLSDDQAWESTIENPQMLQADGGWYLFFSGGDYDNATYAVGYASCAGPTGPCGEPLDHPVLSTAGATVGPGGEWALTDGTGRWWLAYAAWTAGAVGYPPGGDGARSLRIDPLCFVGGQGGDPVVLGPTDGPEPLTPTCPSTDTDLSYRLIGSDGGVFAYGGAPYLGTAAGQGLASPVVGTAADLATGGYWEVAADGSVYAFGAPGLGSMGGRRLASPMVGMAATPDGGGYWEVAADGGIFAFGDARFFGSAGGLPLASPIVGMAVAPGGNGYWLVAADGGVFAYGSAGFFGSMGGHPLNRPIVGLAALPDGAGYWLVASDGGVFAFGAAPYHGSTGNLALVSPVVGIDPSGAGGGYWLVAADGGVFAFGAAPFDGSAGGLALHAPVVGMETG